MEALAIDMLSSLLTAMSFLDLANLNSKICGHFLRKNTADENLIFLNEPWPEIPCLTYFVLSGT